MIQSHFIKLNENNFNQYVSHSHVDPKTYYKNAKFYTDNGLKTTKNDIFWFTSTFELNFDELSKDKQLVI